MYGGGHRITGKGRQGAGRSDKEHGVQLQPFSLSSLQRVQRRCSTHSFLNQNSREAAWITEQIFALDMGRWKEGEMPLTGNSPWITEQRTTAPYPICSPAPHALQGVNLAISFPFFLKSFAVADAQLQAWH